MSAKRNPTASGSDLKQLSTSYMNAFFSTNNSSGDDVPSASPNILKIISKTYLHMVYTKKPRTVLMICQSKRGKTRNKFRSMGVLKNICLITRHSLKRLFWVNKLLTVLQTLQVFLRPWVPKTMQEILI
ncbi:hypothetical protein BB558_007370 [Smittium angustum]|uniref:Uncharacterized protein n=1 Tax=Smittium angustum TaxID=133377 RepID=A0A2U1IV74_SMIAN|nr:hypothetical protein BB558_007370 [Smittium angustum]